MTEPLTLILSATAGLITGVMTGLIPGIHPNTVIFTSLPLYLASGTGLTVYAVFITALSVVHTFHDFLPAIFISSPDAESALTVIDGRSAVEQGKGLEIFQYTAYGALTSLLPVITISGLSILFLDRIYMYLEASMQYILLFFLLFIILNSEEKLNAVLITVFAGALGVISFESTVNQNYVFIPIFSGLFAFPAVLRALKEDFKVPEQDKPSVDRLEAFKGGFMGSIAGFVAGVIPGVGAAVATSFVSPLMKDSSKQFMSAMGAVNTTDIIFSVVTLHVLGNARSGVSVALQFFSTQVDLLLILILTVLSVFPAFYISLKISEVYTVFLTAVPIRKLLYTVLIFLISISFYMTGVTGLLILFTASVIGEASLRSGNRRACMAVLIVPALFFFTGIGAFI